MFPTTQYTRTPIRSICGRRSRRCTRRDGETAAPGGAEIRGYIAAVKTYHDALRYESEHGRSVIRPSLSDRYVFPARAGEKYTGAQPEKWKLFPGLREIIEASTRIRTEAANKPRKSILPLKKAKCEAAAQRRPAKTKRKNRVFSAKRQAVWFETLRVSN